MPMPSGPEVALEDLVIEMEDPAEHAVFHAVYKAQSARLPVGIVTVDDTGRRVRLEAMVESIRLAFNAGGVTDYDRMRGTIRLRLVRGLRLSTEPAAVEEADAPDGGEPAAIERSTI